MVKTMPCEGETMPQRSLPPLSSLTLGEGSRPEFSLIELTAFLWLSFLLPEGRLLLDSSVE